VGVIDFITGIGGCKNFTCHALNFMLNLLHKSGFSKQIHFLYSALPGGYLTTIHDEGRPLAFRISGNSCFITDLWLWQGGLRNFQSRRICRKIFDIKISTGYNSSKIVPKYVQSA